MKLNLAIFSLVAYSNNCYASQMVQSSESGSLTHGNLHAKESLTEQQGPPLGSLAYYDLLIEESRKEQNNLRADLARIRSSIDHGRSPSEINEIQTLRSLIWQEIEFTSFLSAQRSLLERSALLTLSRRLECECTILSNHEKILRFRMKLEGESMTLAEAH